MATVLFITNELYPYDKGGIGRFIYNYCKWNTRQKVPSDLHVLYTRRTMFAENWSDSDELDFVLHTASDLPIIPQEIDALNVCLDSVTMSELVTESQELANLIAQICEKVDHKFDYIEFPDFRGLALAAIRQKKTGAEVFSSSQIVIRLHSAMTLIQIDEGAYHKPSEWFAAVSDAERYCLANADLVVGHLSSIIEYNQRIFGFSGSWVQKTICEFPPIFLSDKESMAASKSVGVIQETSSAGRLFVFSSRFQIFKRPDLFIDGAICYLERNPQTTDKFVLTSYGWDKSFIQLLRRRIPDCYRGHIIVRTDQTHDQRINTLNAGIVVIPSTYESFCIFAYESLLLGRRVILNAKCKAFGLNPFWQENVTCKFFDGTPEGMANTFEKIDEFELPGIPALPQTRPYWLKRPPAITLPSSKPSIDLLLVNPVGSVAEAIAAALGFLECSVIKTAHVLLRGHRPLPRVEDCPEKILIHRIFSDDVTDSDVSNILTKCSGDLILLTETNTAPTVEWKSGIEVALSNYASNALAFPLIEAGGGRPQVHMPVYDCPNLVVSGFGLRLFPVAIARSQLLQLLENRNETSAVFEQAILDICISKQNFDIINLPIVWKGARKPDVISPNMLAHCKARLMRRHLPHLAAFNLELYNPAALVYAAKKSILLKGTLFENGFKKLLGLWRK